MSRGLFAFLTFTLIVATYGRVIQVAEANKCDVCKLSLQEHEPEIIAFMDKACDRLPTEEQDVCKDYVRVVTSSFTPEEICESLKVCPKKYWLGFLG
jgi:hypothetical protein